MATSFATILRDLAARASSAPALTCGEMTWSFKELDARSSQVAQALLASGVRAGDRVAMLSRNCGEFFELIFACNKIGAIFMAINWRLAPPEIDAIIADGTPHVLIHGALGEDTLLTGGVRANPGLTRIIAVGADYDSWRMEQTAIDPGHAGAEDDVALLLYTSGTTAPYISRRRLLRSRGLASCS